MSGVGLILMWFYLECVSSERLVASEQHGLGMGPVMPNTYRMPSRSSLRQAA